nr:ABC transporter substrate-binding protein [Methylogaea oryzae]
MAGAALLLAAGAAGWSLWNSAQQPPIKLGIVHALSGPMDISEKPMVDAELLAVEEINAGGGVLGQPLEPVVADGASDPATYARQVEKLITRDQVSAVIGCWTSACRKTVKPVVERHNHLFIYPMAFEGLETSRNIIYTGAAPSQQIIPAVKWSFDNLGKRYVLVGSDYVWPHSVNAIIRDQLQALGGEAVGEVYLPFGTQDASEAVEKIRELKPDAVFSSIAGDTNLAFYRGLREAGLTAKTTPVVSFSVSEVELQKLSAADMVGHYSAWSYFQSIPRPENEAFVRRFRARYGQNRVVSDVMETAYFSVLLWARAVEQAGSPDLSLVSETILGQSINAPEGIVTVDPATRHTWRSFNMGLIRADGRIEIVWSAEHPIRPVPFPRSRTVKQWQDFLQGLYTAWQQSWTNNTSSRKR